MYLIQSTLQIIVALTLLNVWLLRSGQTTAYRGGHARSMKEEFAVYGLPPWFMYLMGTLKIGVAACLLAGLWLHRLVHPAALLLCVLMIGAFVMHLKQRDTVKKFLPATAMLIMAAALAIL